ncbi:MAG TPA: amidohydrolase family protein [Mycobacteriales bacterium]|nr:amidohydrolase family protein [Mycobacteriales bacterium]HWA68000.1 amidohydrolase family protein [Mycobacteriales bacterium]
MDNERYLVISADCHGGGNITDYKPFLARRWHDEFDAWASTYEIPYEDMKGPDGERNWDSERRLADLEADGIVAEVIYPNTVPPFFPKASLADQPPPQNAGDLAARWAGLQAHNRWLAEFCAKAPGRRAGVAQIMLHNLDEAIAEIHWAKQNGLTGGVLLPGAPPGSGLPPLFDPDYYEPLWATCAELGMPVNHHSGSAAPNTGDRPEDQVILILEVTWWAHRAFTHLLVSGAFERHPDLHLVLTEQGTAWIPDELMRLDFFFDRFRNASGSQEAEWGLPVVERMSLKPSEYFTRQVSVGSSFIRPDEARIRHSVGLDKIMWGSDYPHKEGSNPFTLEALRASFAGIDHDEVQTMLGLNAARVYGFDVDALAPLADKFGPLVTAVDEPLTPHTLPAEAEKCPALVGFGKPE